MPPRARPVRFEMDLTRREVESERLGGAVADKVVARVAGVCQEGCYPNKDNHVNQDAMLTLGREELGSEGELLLGVFDGHGKYGEDCASIAREAFAETLARETARENGLSPGYARTFETVNDVVCKTLGENAGFSGCTAITAMFCADGKIKVGNVGDSRCVVADAELNEGAATGNRHTKRWGVRDLTRDQTCFRADERMRMKEEAENAMTFATIGMVLGGAGARAISATANRVRTTRTATIHRASSWRDVGFLGARSRARRGAPWRRVWASRRRRRCATT